MNRFLHILRLALLFALAGGAQAQSATPLYQISGFRSAHFGMTPGEVRAAIERDFKPATEAVTTIDNPIEKTSVITVRVAKLEPGPGAAVVSYIIGAKSRKLIHVNVAWHSAATASDAARAEIAVAGVQLANYFRAQQWRPNAATSGVRDERKGLVLFAGIDGKNAAVEVRVAGVPTTGADAPALAADQPAELVVSYLADISNPDIATIKPGAF